MSENSQVIDEKIVSMRFDNSKFEANIRTSINSIDKLKQSLNFSSATKAFNEIENNASKINFNPLSAGIQAISGQFSSLQTIAAGTLMSIGSDIYQMEKKIFNDFVISPRKTGFEEYELKMGSVQTILAATGEDLEVVNAYLNDLNKYSDDTIYSFKDMTQSIGKFTNAGVKLEDAVIAMKGISNEAAVSGANAQEASRAMYNLAQSLSMGYVQYIDWKSIENANMATVEFKQNLADVAVNLGKVKRVGNDAYTVNGKNYNLQSLFKDALKDQWLSTEVLIQTLKDYADETTEIGQKAYAAAKDVKTFSMMMDTLKEAAQSGWAQTWEILFGDFEEGKKLWTGISKVLGEIIDASSSRRNSFLENILGKDLVTYEQWSEMMETSGINEWKFSKMMIDAAENHGIAAKKLVDANGSFRESLKAGWLTYDIFNEVIKGYDKEIETTVKDMSNKLEEFKKVANDVNAGRYGNGAQRKKLLAEAGYDYDEIQDLVNRLRRGETLLMDDLTETEMKAIGYTEREISLLREFNENAKVGGKTMAEYLNIMNGLDRRTKVIEALGNLFQWLSYRIDGFTTGFKAVFKDDYIGRISEIINSFYDFSKNLSRDWNEWNRFERLGEGIGSVFHLIATTVYEISRVITALITTIFPNLAGSGLETAAIIGDGLSDICKKVEEFIRLIADSTIYMIKFGKESETVNTVFDVLKKSLLVIGYLFTSFGKYVSKMNIGSVSENFKALKKYIKQAYVYVKPVLKSMLKYLSDIADKNAVLRTIKNSIIDMAKEFKNIQWPSLSDIVNIFDDLEDYLEANDQSSTIVDRIVGTFTYLANNIIDIFGPAMKVFVDGLITAGKQVLDYVRTILSAFSDFYAGIKYYLGIIISEIKRQFMELINLSIYDKTSLINCLAFFNLLLNLIRMIRSGSTLASAAAKALAKYGKVGVELAKLIKSLRKGWKGAVTKAFLPKIINSLTKMILALTLMIAVLTFLPKNQLIEAITAIGYLSIIAILFSGAMTILSKAFDGSLASAMKSATTFILSLVISVGIIIGAIYAVYKLCETLDGQELGRAAAIVGLIAIVLMSLAALYPWLVENKTTGLGAALSIVALAASILIIIQAIKQLYDIGYTGYDILGIVGLLATLGIISGLMLRLAGSGGSIRGAIMIVALVLSIKSLINEVYQLAIMYKASYLNDARFESIIQGIVKLIISLGILIGATVGLSALSTGSKLLASFAIIVAAIVGIVQISEELYRLDRLDIDVKPIIYLCGSLVAIVISIGYVIRQMSKLAIDPMAMNRFYRSMLLFIGCMATISLVIFALSNIKDIKNAIIGALSIAVLIEVIRLMIQDIDTIPGGGLATLSGLAIAILSLSAALLLLSNVPFTNLAKGLAIIGGGLLLLAFAGRAMETVADGIVFAGLAFVAVSAGLLIAAKAISILATACTELSNVNWISVLSGVGVLAITAMVISWTAVALEGMVPVMAPVGNGLLALSVPTLIFAAAIWLLCDAIATLFGYNYRNLGDQMMSGINEASIQNMGEYKSIGELIGTAIGEGIINTVKDIWDKSAPGAMLNDMSLDDTSGAILRPLGTYDDLLESSYKRANALSNRRGRGDIDYKEFARVFNVWNTKHSGELSYADFITYMKNGRGFGEFMSDALNGKDVEIIKNNEVVSENTNSMNNLSNQIKNVSNGNWTGIVDFIKNISEGKVLDLISEDDIGGLAASFQDVIKNMNPEDVMSNYDVEGLINTEELENKISNLTNTYGNLGSSFNLDETSNGINKLIASMHDNFEVNQSIATNLGFIQEDVSEINSKDFEFNLDGNYYGGQFTRTVNRNIGKLARLSARG